MYPELEYRGFVGFEEDKLNRRGISIQPRSNQSFYFPQLLIQPLVGSEPYIDFDVYSSPYVPLLFQALNEGRPIISSPLPSYNPLRGKNVFVLHPGVMIEGHENRGLASLLVSFRAFIDRVALSYSSDSVWVYIYDMTAPEVETPFGAAYLQRNSGDFEMTVTLVESQSPLNMIQSDKSKERKLLYRDIQIAQQTWRVLVVSEEDSFGVSASSTIIGGVLMVVACLFLVTWFLSNNQRQRKIHEVKLASDAEKAALVVQHAEESVQAERERNEFLAHEVRNPLASALAAASFLEVSVSRQRAQNETDIATSGEANGIIEDVSVIRSSVSHINDLLRSMLDVNKVACQQMVLNSTTTDLYRDILEPVRTMINRRSNRFTVEVSAPDDIILHIDKMRLKQVVLNLAGNAVKFVSVGFIRLKAQVTKSSVVISIEDSGPGVPKDKRDELFSRYQASLDRLSQGSGVGLYLSQGLVKLMGGVLFLDTTYNSGIEGSPGSRFVIELPKRVLVGIESKTDAANITVTESSESADFKPQLELPERLSVLLVDDDTVLRKMLARSIQRVAPSWSIRQASNGETALSLTETECFDLILVDHYMASYEQSLLGTETIMRMRAAGVDSRICGLSANAMEESFREAGADYFLLKPFSTDTECLTHDLCQALGISGEQSKINP